MLRAMMAAMSDEEKPRQDSGRDGNAPTLTSDKQDFLQEGSNRT